MTFTQLNAILKNFLMGWLLVLGLEEGYVECATLCVKSWVILKSENSVGWPTVTVSASKQLIRASGLRRQRRQNWENAVLPFLVVCDQIVRFQSHLVARFSIWSLWTNEYTYLLKVQTALWPSFKCHQSRRCFRMEGALTLIFWKSESSRDIKK